MSPTNAHERGLLAVKQAKHSLSTERAAEAASLLAQELPGIQALGDLGLLVQAEAALGEALLAQGKHDDAILALERTTALWSEVSALRWIQTLPSGEQSQLAVREAASAAAGAAFRRAETWFERNSVPVPEFVWTNTSDRKHHTTELQRLREALQSYFENSIRPWIEHQRNSIEIAERQYAQVLWVPPVVTPYWRIAVAAKTGLMWGQFVSDLRRVPELPRPHAEALLVHGGFDDPNEGHQQYARSAIETCIELSRKYRIVSQYTRACEAWLADHYKAEHHRLDEWMPPASWLPNDPLRKQPPASLLTR